MCLISLRPMLWTEECVRARLNVSSGTADDHLGLCDRVCVWRIIFVFRGSVCFCGLMWCLRSTGVPVSSRVSAKIQQLVNTLKQPRRPPLREFFVDDFEELLEGTCLSQSCSFAERWCYKLFETLALTMLAWMIIWKVIVIQHEWLGYSDSLLKCVFPCIIQSSSPTPTSRGRRALRWSPFEGSRWEWSLIGRHLWKLRCSVGGPSRPKHLAWPPWTPMANPYTSLPTV